MSGSLPGNASSTPRRALTHFFSRTWTLFQKNRGSQGQWQKLPSPSPSEDKFRHMQRSPLPSLGESIYYVCTHRSGSGSRNGAKLLTGSLDFCEQREARWSKYPKTPWTSYIEVPGAGDLIELGNRGQLLFQGKRSRMKYRKESEGGFSISVGRPFAIPTRSEQAIAHAGSRMNE